MFSILNCVTLMIKVFVNHIFYFANIQYSIKGGGEEEKWVTSLCSWIVGLVGGIDGTGFSW